MEENNPNVEQNTNQVENAPVNQTQEVPVSETTTSTVNTQNTNGQTENTQNTHYEQMANNTTAEAKKLNICCLLSFIFAMVGIIMYGFFCGIIATILGIIGVATFKPQSQKAKGFGIAGLAVGAVEFVIMGLMIFSSVASVL